MSFESASAVRSVGTAQGVLAVVQTGTAVKAVPIYSP